MCYLAYAKDLDMSTEEWFKAGLDLFYFNQMYHSEENDFDDPPVKACTIDAIHGKKIVKQSQKVRKLKINTLKYHLYILQLRINSEL